MKEKSETHLKDFLESLKSFFQIIFAPQRILGIMLMLIGIAVGFLGYFNRYEKLQLGEFANRFLSDFYANISTDLVSIALTILVIDYLNEKRATEQKKYQLVRELGSSDHGFATRAVRELIANEWLYDGSLNGAYLSGANLHNEDLYGLQMTDGWLIGANLEYTNLNDATISNVIMNGSKLTNARMWNINLSKTSLGDSVLYGTQMTKGDLREVRMPNSNLVNAVLSDSNMEWASLDGSDLSSANLTNVNLDFGRLIEANLSNANLSGATLKNTHMYRANFTNTNLENVDFEFADCRNIVLLGARLDITELSKARSLRGAIMPDGSRYDGRFRLFYDELDAKSRGVDIDDPEVRKWWYLNDG